MADRVLISACLLGAKTRYDGAGKINRPLLARLADRCLVPVCPEQLGGLPTPRPPSYFMGGDGAEVLAGRAKLINTHGRDVTENYIRGAEEVLRIARQLGVTEAYVKSRSPSCGAGHIILNGKPCEGNGVCTALLLQHGFEVHEVD